MENLITLLETEKQKLTMHLDDMNACSDLYNNESFLEHKELLEKSIKEITALLNFYDKEVRLSGYFEWLRNLADTE